MRKDLFIILALCLSLNLAKTLALDIPSPATEDEIIVLSHERNDIVLAAVTGPSGTTCVDSGKCVGKRDGTMYADPNSKGYIVCQCECQIIMPCAPGTQFDESLQTCNHINAGGDGGSGGLRCADPGLCAGQPNGIRFPNTKTNASYVECQDQCEIERLCEPGLVYNATTATCVNASGGSATTCIVPGISCISAGKCARQPDGTILPAANNTSYIVCLCKCEILRLCAEDTIFHDHLNACVHVSGNGTSSGSNNNNSSGNTSGSGSGSSNSTGTGTGSGSQSNGNSSCQALGIRCRHPGVCTLQRDGAIFAHPNTTTGYIECVCQCEQERSCLPGMGYNATLKYCVYINGTSGEGNGNSSGNGTNGTGSGNHSGNSSCQSLGIYCRYPGICAAQANGAIFANPRTKTGYIECMCQCEQERSCAPGLVFESTYKFCVHVNGTNGGGNGTVIIGNNTATGSGNHSGNSSCQSLGIYCRYPGICAAQANGAIFANPRTKTGYIECMCQCEQERSCAPGLVFESTYKFCVHVNGTNGGGNGSVIIGNNTATGSGNHSGNSSCQSLGIYCRYPGICAAQANGAIFANPRTKTGYIECMCQCEQERSCAPGLVFESTYKFCVHVNGTNGGGNGTVIIGNNTATGSGNHSGNSSCQSLGIHCRYPGICAAQANGAIFANPRTKTGYIECMCQCEQERSCAPGLVFESTYKFCVHVNGTSGGGNGSGTTGNNTATGSGNHSGNSSCQALGIHCRYPGICAAQPNGAIFTNPITKTGYIECMCQCEQERSCAAGLVFNATLKYCVYINGTSTGWNTNGNSTCDSGQIRCAYSGKCARQPNGAIFAVNNKPTEYIECLCECEQKRSCHPGTVFNSTAKMCKHIIPGQGNVVQCSSRGKCAGQLDGAKFSNPNTTMGYIECQSQCEIRKWCSPGFAFNATRRMCVYVTEGQGSNHTCSNGSCGSHNSTNTGGVNKCNTPAMKCIRQGRCAGRPDGFRFADPTTSKGYIECVCQCEWKKSCAPGLKFNGNLNMCIHVTGGVTSNSTCSHGSCGGHNSTNTGTNTGGINKCNAEGVQCIRQGRCAGLPDGFRFADPKTSKGFIECVCQCEWEKSCAPGLIFDDKWRMCIHTTDGVITNGTTACSHGSCTGNNATHNGSIIGGGTTGNDCAAMKLNCTHRAKCAGQLDGTIFSSPWSNYSYIVCKCECDLMGTCAPGTVFNRNLKSCVHLHGSESGSGNGNSSHIGGGSSSGCGVCYNPGKCLDQPDGRILGNVNASTFTVCICGCPIEMSCEPGSRFNETLNMCVHTNCAGNNGGTCHGGNIDHDHNGNTVTSGSGNSNSTSSWTGSSGSETSGGSLNSGGIVSEGSEGTASSHKPNTGNGVNGSDLSTGSTGIKCTNSRLCLHQPDGKMFTMPNSTGYVVCQQGCEIHMPCAPGTKFSEILQTCDYV